MTDEATRVAMRLISLLRLGSQNAVLIALPGQQSGAP